MNCDDLQYFFMLTLQGLMVCENYSKSVHELRTQSHSSNKVDERADVSVLWTNCKLWVHFVFHGV